MQYFDICLIDYFIFFFFNDTATTEIYTLSLHDALPISYPGGRGPRDGPDLRGRMRHTQHQEPQRAGLAPRAVRPVHGADRKSTRLNSSHLVISYAVFCLKKKKKNDILITPFI